MMSKYTFSSFFLSSLFALLSCFSEILANIYANDTTPSLDIHLINNNVKITWEKVEGAVGYKIYHGSSRLSAKSLIATVNVSELGEEKTFANRVVYAYTHTSPNQKKYENHYRIVPVDAQGNTIVFIEWGLGAINGAVSYEIQRTSASDGEFSKVGNAAELGFVDKVSNFDRYQNRYRIAGLNAAGEYITNNRDEMIFVITGAIILDFEQIISFEKKLFGGNMLFYDARFDDGEQIAMEINRIHWDEMFTSPSGPAHGQFSFRRYSMNFKSGEYRNFGDLQIGYYTSFAGLGKLPADTRFYGSITIPAPLSGGNATCTFWRSIENFEVNKVMPEDNTSLFRWAVSQAAPARRLSINVRMVFDWNGEPGMNTPWASGGFLSDSRFTAPLGSVNQQQWYTRNSHFGHSEFFGDNWNRVTQGVTGHPYTSNWIEGGARTNIEKTPIVREKPFLYLDGETYKVFVPAWRYNSEGISWNHETGFPGEGYSLNLENDFYIAKPGDTAAKINERLDAGKNIFFTPGWYDLETPIRVNRPNAILLGTGYATLFPGENNREGAIFIDDVPGVIVAHIMLDALYNSTYLIRVGDQHANKDHSSNPTILSDIFVRVGGYKPENVNADVSVQINSNNVIGDHLWIWRADHGAGVGWDRNTGDFGLIVSGDNVIMYGLFVEHYQKYETLWMGENGQTFFYQNESPYDPTNQSAYMSHNGTVNGWASYKVANWIDNHNAIAMGMYGVFNRTGADRRQSESVFMENAIEAPNKPNVKIEHAIITELSVRPTDTNNVAICGTNSIVNGTGQGITNQNMATARRLVSYNNGVAVLPANVPENVNRIGISPQDETFDYLPTGTRIRGHKKRTEGLTLTFNDEFTGNKLDQTKWTHQSGVGRIDPVTGENYGLTSWGNSEQQFYKPENTVVENGMMKIYGRRENAGNGEEARNFTSSRLRTKGNFAQRYGRFEAKMKIPAIAGFWPALWLMPEPPDDHPTRGIYGGWPNSGEIDVMEARGTTPNRVGQAIHFGVNAPRTHRYIHNAGDYILPNDGRIDEFNVYGVDWYHDRIEFFVNDVIVFAIPASEWKQRSGAENIALSHPQSSTSAPFDQKFHIIINLAIGGHFDRGALPPDEFKEAAMEIEWVRVWQFEEYL